MDPQRTSPEVDGVRNMSHGRGGAGNISQSTRRDSASKPDELVTPTIKSALYTTGRGGSGNMARNDPTRPDLARAAQDVEAPPGAGREPDGPHHFGRGGAANVVSTGGGDAPRKSAEIAAAEREERERLVDGAGGKKNGSEDVRGLGEKAKDLFGKIGGKK